MRFQIVILKRFNANLLILNFVQIRNLFADNPTTMIPYTFFKLWQPTEHPVESGPVWNKTDVM